MNLPGIPRDGNVVDLKAMFADKKKIAGIEALRNRLDEMAVAAHEADNQLDRAACDAGSFALTYILKEFEQQ
jgi:hypothetical protein